MIKKDVTIGDCRLILGDCAEVMPGLGWFDAVVTDPPYGINIANNPVRQAHCRKDWDSCAPTAEIIAHICGASKAQIIWGGNYFNLNPSRCFLVWDKKQPENFSLAMCEMAWTSLDANAKIFRHSVTNYQKQHPTQKPVALMKWCLTFLPDAQTILDPFMGSGTTLVACAQMGKAGTGIEQDPGYFEIACERIRKAYEQPDLFVEPVKAKPDQIQLQMGGGR